MSPTFRNYTLKSTEVHIVPAASKANDAQAWEVVLLLKEQNERLTAQLKDVKRLILGCAYGEEKLVMQCLRETLHING